MKEESWQQLLERWIEEGAFVQATLSQPRNKGKETAAKVVVRPVLLKNGLHYQFESHFANKAFHLNVEAAQAASRMAELINRDYKQALMKSEDRDVQLLFNKKGKATMKELKASGGARQAELQHNRPKERMLEEGKVVPFLVELGIMTPEGKVYARKQDKYKQINRFLEMVSDVLHALPQDREVTIVDFGCGKSYLTFALYHLLAIEQGRSIRVIGLDLKADVIAFCSDLAGKLGFSKLQFLVGDIAEYEELHEADMVVTLHACDTATDAALAKAISWGASVILSVPCCQHELFRQVQSEELSPILSHGLLKERFAALATDAARGSLLETLGYKVQMLEFVDPEHTPKNLLIRAFMSGNSELSMGKWKEYESYRDYLHLSPALERMLQDRLPHQA
ncbi:SAM-dependent methyltransferase [Paenibacillus sp. HB172176]|uniref:class I SAM-dependent methyltransferase n=1 Tax=Paenibacillus sp. HB172176 TaxID=2493690 RepID=UPI00143C5F12|nr:SAM-dependent methyltransferase [Paenibacillus sp. HB172176]